MFKQYLKKVVEGDALTETEAKQAMDIMMSGEASSAQIASLLTVLRFRGETTDEMTGFARSMREHVVTVNHDMEVVDTCGTGGDGCSTFNISTASSLVVAAMGVKVAKHGNRAMSSKSGSADVLDYLGIPTQSGADEAVRSLREHHMCFLFAQQYHVSMKHAAPTRKEIGFRTIFNLIGPLTNPAGSRRQLIGVFDTSFAEKMAQTLRNLGAERAMIVTGGDGLDECSITSHTDAVFLENGQITRSRFAPEDFGLNRGRMEHLQVHSAAESGEMIREVLNGKGNRSATDIVLLNAGAALYVAGGADTIAEGIHQARGAIESGQVRDHLLSMQQAGKVEFHA
ncbi:MAG TPA: anthranilate phosphoribosyltransferase [Bacillales bacterium]|nr:anthranilate phosphoribosyltransferase [Bacillales bacterium]